MKNFLYACNIWAWSKTNRLDSRGGGQSIRINHIITVNQLNLDQSLLFTKSTHLFPVFYYSLSLRSESDRQWLLNLFPRHFSRRSRFSWNYQQLFLLCWLHLPASLSLSESVCLLVMSDSSKIRSFESSPLMNQFTILHSKGFVHESFWIIRSGSCVIHNVIFIFLYLIIFVKHYSKQWGHNICKF